MQAATKAEATAEEVVDILVFGSGAGGLAASLFAAKRGMKVLLCEKSSLLGGTTATSGGVLWVPGNRQAKEAGIDDPIENARTYLRHELGNYYREDLAEAFLESAGPAIDDIEDGTSVAFDLIQSPDYHPDSPGGVDKGRSIMARRYDGNELGPDFELVRPPMDRLMVCGGMMVGPDEIPAFVRPFASMANFSRVLRRLARHGLDRLGGGAVVLLLVEGEELQHVADGAGQGAVVLPGGRHERDDRLDDVQAVVEDAALAPGGCRVHTRGGKIDASLDAQLDRITADLMPAPEEAGVPA